jgi:hypothetical protein
MPTYFDRQGFAWRRSVPHLGIGLMCAPAEDAHDPAAWCDVDDFSAEPEIQQQVEAAREALRTCEWQEAAAYLSAGARDAHIDAWWPSIAAERSAARLQIGAAHSYAAAREALGIE